MKFLWRFSLFLLAELSFIFSNAAGLFACESTEVRHFGKALDVKLSEDSGLHQWLMTAGDVLMISI